ncbi:MAG: hypothetical protein V7785_08095 [Bermanella sp.]
MYKVLGLFLLVLSTNLYAECGYGKLTSVRLDHTGSTFRVSFSSQATVKNGCSVSDVSLVVDPGFSNYLTLEMAMSLSLTALTAGKSVWVEYDSSNNYLKKINIYSDL